MTDTTITVLVDNTATTPGCRGEHGLSILVERPDGVVLWDTGQSALLIENAAALTAPLDTIGSIALSHGHYDHTGGLAAVLDTHGPATVYAHPGIFTDRSTPSRSAGHTFRHIGCPFTEDELVRRGAAFSFSSTSRDIMPGVHMTGEIPRNTSFEDVGGEFYLGEDTGRPDPVADDQSLVVETADGPVLLLGCCHAGIVNTVIHVSEACGIDRFRLIAGGMHLINADTDRTVNTLDALSDIVVDEFAPGHCTGEAAACAFRERFHGRVTGFGVGRRWTFS